MRHATFVKYVTNWQQLILKICKSRQHCSLFMSNTTFPLPLLDRRVSFPITEGSKCPTFPPYTILMTFFKSRSVILNSAMALKCKVCLHEL